MAIDIARLLARRFNDVRQSYGAKDCILYALGLGLGQDPLDESQLRFTYEQGLEALPTMAVVLGYPGFWQRDPSTGIDWTGIVHGEQRLRLHRPLATTGEVVSRLRVDAVIDKGEGKGALVHSSRELRTQDGEALLCTIQATSFCRFDGGCGQGEPAMASSVEPLKAVPERKADAVHRWKTMPQAAQIYRLCGDDNPLHVSPKVAREAGFDRPILHGLCTYGIAGLAVVALCNGGDPSRLRQLDARFTSPVYPGETIVTELWMEGFHEGERHARVRCSVMEREVVVLDRGYAAWLA
jgi:acyl dehydratase